MPALKLFAEGQQRHETGENRMETPHPRTREMINSGFGGALGTLDHRPPHRV